MNTVKLYAKLNNVQSILFTKKTNFDKIKTPQVISESYIIDKFVPLAIIKKRYPQEYIANPVTFIEELESFKKGDGVRAIKNIVRKSLTDKSEGRVAFYACLMDFKKGHPMGFYYKLGFRSISKKYNEICEKWLQNGGNEKNRPFRIKWNIFAPQEMYLPKENIQQCLNYPEKFLFYKG